MREMESETQQEQDRKSGVGIKCKAKTFAALWRAAASDALASYPDARTPCLFSNL